jgi:hypothetical protein
LDAIKRREFLDHPKIQELLKKDSALLIYVVKCIVFSDVYLHCIMRAWGESLGGREGARCCCLFMLQAGDVAVYIDYTDVH